MKYILKKDLPFTKAGHKVEVNPSGCLPFVNYSTGVFSTTEEYVDKLLSEGWIEEVKPREWYEVETRKPDGTWNSHSHLRYYNEQSARDATCRCEVNAKFIKVREVTQW